MRLQHPEYIQKPHKQRDSLRFGIGMAMLIGVAFASNTAVYADTETSIVYAPTIKGAVEIGISPDSVAIKVDSKQSEAAETKTSDFVFSASVPLTAEVQEYIWNKCKAATSDYVNYYYFMLGAIQVESSFKSKAIHYNSNGSVDRGLCQINSCNVKKMKNLGLINSTDDLFDIHKNIDCGFEMMNKYINMFGVSEAAYYAYNTGREKSGSNANSRTVMKYMSEWQSVLS